MPINWSMRASACGVRRLQRRSGKGAVDIAGDGAGLVEHEAVMDQGRHAAEGMEREVVGRDVGANGFTSTRS